MTQWIFFYTGLLLLGFLASFTFLGGSWRPSQKAQALHLGQWLQDWQLQTDRGEATSLNELPDYRFYTQLLKQLLQQVRLYGEFPRELMWEWRRALQSEHEFDQKWRGVCVSAWAQLGMMLVMTWTFVWLGSWSLELTLKQTSWELIVFLQSGAIASLSGGLHWLKRRLNAGQAEIFQALYTFRLLSPAGVSTNILFHEAGLAYLGHLQVMQWKVLKEKILKLAAEHLQQGTDLSREAELLAGGLVPAPEQLTQTVKHCEKLELAVLVVFCLPAYFVFVFSLLSQLH